MNKCIVSVSGFCVGPLFDFSRSAASGPKNLSKQRGEVSPKPPLKEAPRAPPGGGIGKGGGPEVVKI